MADLILIPVILLLLYKIEYKRDGVFDDYLSIERTNILKAIMAINVLLSHCTLDYINLNSKLLNVTSGDDAVKIFFFLSGYGLAVSYKRKGSAYINNFFSRRFAKILVPAIIVIIPNLLFFKFTGFCYYIEDLSPATFLKVFIENGYTLVINSWFVIELCILYIAFYLAVKLSKGDYNTGIRNASVFTVIIMGAFYVVYMYKEWLPVWFFSTYAFAFGLMWGAREESFVKRIKKHFDYVYLIGLPLGMILMIGMNVTKPFLDANLYDVLKNLFVGPIMVAAVILAGMKIRVGNKVWTFLGKISYEIYLIHGVFINIYRCNKLYIESDILYVLCAVASSLLGAVILHYASKLILDLYFKAIDTIGKKEN